MEIYITLCVGDWSTGTSDFIEAAGTECFETRVFVLFFFPPASLERNSFAPIRKKFYYSTKSPGSLRATDKKTSLKKRERKKKKFSNISPAKRFSESLLNPKPNIFERIENIYSIFQNS